MLQKINLAVMLIVLLAVGVVGWRSLESQLSTSNAIHEVRAEIADLARGLGVSPKAGEAASSGVMAAPTTEFVSVLGMVNREGPIEWTPKTTLVKVICICGGFKQYARTNSVRIIRKGEKTGTRIIDFDKIVEGEIDDVALEANDVIFVPESVF